MKKIAIICLIFGLNQFGFAQIYSNPTDSLKTEKETLKIKKFILPASLLAVGGVLKIKSVQNNVQNNARNLFGDNFFTKVDDFTQYVPAAQMFGGNFLGYQSKHGNLQMATNLLVSNLMVTGLTLAVKTYTKDKRPDDTGDNSFPSGHTAVAFTNATLLFYEYKDSNFWYASSGYLFAVATGVLRVANNRHWSGDVFAGAGIGIAVGTIVSHWNPFNFDEKSNFVAYPVFGNNSFGAGCQFKLD